MQQKSEQTDFQRRDQVADIAERIVAKFWPRDAIIIADVMNVLPLLTL